MFGILAREPVDGSYLRIAYFRLTYPSIPSFFWPFIFHLHIIKAVQQRSYTAQSNNAFSQTVQRCNTSCIPTRLLFFGDLNLSSPLSPSSSSDDNCWVWASIVRTSDGPGGADVPTRGASCMGAIGAGIACRGPVGGENGVVSVGGSATGNLGVVGGGGCWNGAYACCGTYGG